MANPLYFPIFRAFDSNGNPLSFGKVYTYEAGTSTPKATYTTSSLMTQNTNPVILDAEGYPESGGIWLDGIYKIDLYDQNDVQQDGFPVDNFQNDPGATGPAGTFQMATAGGTVDAITANYSPDVTLTNLVTVGFVASGANTITNPTFSPDGLAAQIITKKGGVALVPGDIPGALAVCLVEYNSANTRWELLNPASERLPWVVATGTADAIAAIYSPVVGTLYDGLILSFRAVAANATTTPTFAPNGLTARTITKSGGSALAAGDIAGNLAEYFVRYNLANTRWELLNPTVQTIPAYSTISGFLPSLIAGTSTTASLTTSAGQASDSTNIAYITKATTTSWAVTNGNAINGYQGGTTLPNSSTIHFFICSGSSGTGVFAHNGLSPTFPSGYNTYSRRIFSLNTTSAGALIPVNVIETEGGSLTANLVTQVLETGAAISVGTSRISVTLTVPTGIKVKPNFRATTPDGVMIITGGDESDIAPTGTGPWTTVPGSDLYSIAGGGGVSNQLGDYITNTSGQIFVRATASARNLYVVSRGFKDFRRS
jgi:hypothetical protein